MLPSVRKGRAVAKAQRREEEEDVTLSARGGRVSSLVDKRAA